MHLRNKRDFFLNTNLKILCNMKISTVQHWLLPSPCLQRWRCLLHLTYQKRFCCACWSIPMSSRSWCTMRRTGTRAVTTSSTGTRRWIISSSFCRCVDVSHGLTHAPHLYQQMWHPFNSGMRCAWLHLVAEINQLKLKHDLQLSLTCSTIMSLFPPHTQLFSTLFIL